VVLAQVLFGLPISSAVEYNFLTMLFIIVIWLMVNNI
jgi:hypothetical protein